MASETQLQQAWGSRQNVGAREHGATDSGTKEADHGLEHVEDGATFHKYEGAIKAGLSCDDARFLTDFPAEQQRKTFRKVDFHVVPMLAILYLISHLDRANIGNAKIEGLEASLGMAGSDYNIAVSIFFIPYILCEIPSNMILARFNRPSTYIGVLVMCWSLMVVLSGVVTNFAGLCFTRFFVGFFEAGFFPGAVWLISQWYPPNKTQSRNALFYVSSAASGAFSGLLAAAIAQMDGIGGYRGWRWIFIIEGIASFLIGVSVFFLLPDTPELAGRWLSPEEQRFLRLTHHMTRGVPGRSALTNETARPFKWKFFKQVVTDYRIYLQALICASNTVPNNGLKFTMPQIIRNMGFRSTIAQLLSAPPYVAGATAAVLFSLWADKYSRRMPPIVICQALLVVGMSVLFKYASNITENVVLCYSMVILSCIGVYPIVPASNAWTINNLAGPEKRLIGIAFMVTMGNTGGFVGSWVFQEREAPRYPTGFGTSLAFGAAGIVAALVLEYSFARHNKKWAAITQEEISTRYTAQELEEVGDRSPLFKYQL